MSISQLELTLHSQSIIIYIITMAKKEAFDLEEVINPNCERKCNRERRYEITEDNLCSETRSVIDGLPIRCVGEWAQEKIHYLVNYFNIFTISMKEKWGGNIYYIEICSGPGRCIDRKSGTEFNGTSLCIVQNHAFKFLKKAIFFDYNQHVVETLGRRLETRGITTARAYVGDYYDPVQIRDHIMSEIQGNGLFLIFIDPTDCSVPFELIKCLKEGISNIDFIINFPVGSDFNRNIGNAIGSPKTHEKVIEKYRNFLGYDDFFRDQRLQKADNLQRRNIFREYYINSFRRIGYKYFDSRKIRNYYDLMFASSHEKGIEFWEKINRTGFDGQRSIPF